MTFMFKQISLREASPVKIEARIKVLMIDDAIRHVSVAGVEFAIRRIDQVLMILDNGHRGRAERLLDTGLVVPTRVLKRKPGRFAACRDNEGGCMQDHIYTPGALYVARASTGTKCNAPLMEVSRM